LISLLGRYDEVNKKKGDKFKLQDMFKSDIQHNQDQSAAVDINADAAYSIDAEIISSYEANLSYSVRNVINEIKTMDKEFSIDEFLDKVQKAFAVIVKSIADEDKKTLEFLLAPNIYRAFTQRIDQLIESNQKLTQRIVNIRSINIDDASIDGENIAKITLSITSEQIIFVQDKQTKAILEGNESRTERIVDSWSFTRNYGAKNSIWLLSETR